ncbi:MAG: hypothetical protein FD180_4364 [Planctomycetota bacterium]|nr:MAG: hypothetical protein FD180_4364 [Planctomycetota bacterium]
MPTTTATSLRPGLWSAPDCDLRVLAHVPRPLAFAVVASTLARQRVELSANVLTAGGAGDDAEAVIASIPDLTPLAARMRNPSPDRLPRGRVLARLTWSLRRARVFLESFAPPTHADDPILEDRAFDLLVKIVFLLDIVDAWRDPAAAAIAVEAADPARRTG